MEAKVLSYHDVLLRKKDVEVLRGPRWLNDQVIDFYFEYLGREQFKHQPNILFVGCSMAFLLANSDPNTAEALLQSMEASVKQLVLMPVNNNPDISQAEGGSHWSLLVFHRPSFSLKHFDSHSGCNRGPAAKLAGTLQSALQGICNKPHAPRVVEHSCPQQENGYDCGVYVLWISQQVATWHASGSSGDLDLPHVLDHGTPTTITAFRKCLLELVEFLVETTSTNS